MLLSKTREFVMVARTVALLFAAPTLLITTPCLAQADAGGHAVKSKLAADPDRKICRTVDTTGSIMVGARVCHTKAEWSAIDGTNSKAASDMRDPRGRFGGQGVRGGN